LAQQPTVSGELLPVAPSVTIRPELLRIGSREMTIGLSGPGMRKGQPGQWGLAGHSFVPDRATPELQLGGTWMWNRAAENPAVSWVLDAHEKSIPNESHVEADSGFADMRDALGG